MTASMRRHLQALADAAGAERFLLIRERNHLVVDFWFPGAAKPSRLTMSKTCSDDARGFKNQVADLRRLKGSHT